MKVYRYYWNNQPVAWLLKDRPCRVLARGRGPGPRNVAIEMLDTGTRYVTARRALRGG